MLPFNSLNQYPDVEHTREPRPANRLEVQTQMLNQDRLLLVPELSALGMAGRQGQNPLTMTIRAIQQGVASLLTKVAGHDHRGRHATRSGIRSVSPGDHICVPGVDC